MLYDIVSYYRLVRRLLLDPNLITCNENADRAVPMYSRDSVLEEFLSVGIKQGSVCGGGSVASHRAKVDAEGGTYTPV